MGDDGQHLACAVLHDRLGRLDQRAARVGHVVDQDGHPVPHAAHQRHARHLVRLRTLLVDQRERKVEPVGHRRGPGERGSVAGSCARRDGYARAEREGNGRNLPLRPAGIRADDDGVLDADVVADPAQHARLGVQIVDGHVEEALDLAGVQVHGDDVVAAGRLQHVGDQLGRDGRARLVLLVLARVGEVGDDGRDAPRRGRLARRDDDQQLHDVVVDLAGRRGLQDEDCRKDGFSGWRVGEARGN